MSKTFELLRQAGTFFVSTVNGDVPATRPFGAVMEYDGEIYFSTAVGKDVYSQLKLNPAVQIVAMTGESRQWLRVNGKAAEVFDLQVKQAMLDACPNLIRHFEKAGCESFALFKVAERESILFDNSGKTKLED